MSAERREPYFAFICAAIFCGFAIIHQPEAFAYTGCPGDTNIVAEYFFHEGTGSTTYNTGTDEESGDLSLTNGVSFSADVPPPNAGCGFSVTFPDTGSGNSTPALQSSSNYDPLAGAESFTIMAWVKRASSGNGVNQAARIVSDIASGSGVMFRFKGSSGVLYLQINGTDKETTVGGIAPTSNVWHHVAVVYDSTRTVTNELSRNVHFYVDGVQRGDGNLLSVVPGSNSVPLTIGNSSTSRSKDSLLVGSIDDVRIMRGFAPDAVGNGKTNATIWCLMNRSDDFEPPTITCPANATADTDAGSCTASNVSLGTPSASDDCGSVTVTNDAPASFPLGVSTVTWTARDAAGNVATCAQTVTIRDSEPPTIDCSGTVIVSNSPGQCIAVGISLDPPTASDNCGNVTIWSNAPQDFPVGSTFVLWTGFDEAGNTNTCTQEVIVLDAEPPAILCPSSIVVTAAVGSCVASNVALGTPDVSDNCGISSVSNDAPIEFIATTVVTWTVVDTHGNSNSCQQTVTVVENSPVDTDSDGLSDCAELLLGTDPELEDTDGDGMPDGWEVQYGLNPLDPADAAQDTDGDELTNLEEYLAGTNPRSRYFDQQAGWWRFDETNGVVAVDSSAQNVPGTLVNMSDDDRVPGRYANGLSFNGTNSAVCISRVDGSRLALIGEELTVSAWIKVSTSSSGEQVVFSLGEQNGWGTILSLTNDSPRLAIRVASGSSTQQFAVAVTNQIVNAQWMHVVGVYSGSRRSLALYLNGVLLQLNDLLPSGSPVVNQGDSHAGSAGTNFPAKVILGLLDDVRVYNIALSQGAVAELFAGANVTGEIEFDVVTDWTEHTWASLPEAPDDGESQSEEYTPPPLPDASTLEGVLRHQPCILN